MGSIDAPPDSSPGERPKAISQHARELSTHPATVFRWVQQGLSLDGTRVRLKAVRIGGRWKIYPSDMADFLSRINERGEEAAGESPDPSPTARRKSAEVAARELDRIGI